jgi:hypothetical protein
VSIPPSITAQPQEVVSIVGADATFSVQATGTPTLSYQWRFNGNNISGANAPTLTLTNLAAGSAGAYSVVITNSFGQATSNNAGLIVLSEVTISTGHAIVWPALATRAGYILEEADSPGGPWQVSSVTPGSFQDKHLILIDTSSATKRFYRLHRP